MCKFLFSQIYLKVDYFDQKYNEYQKFMMSRKNGGKVEHFSEVFEKTKAEAALAAGIFHREEVHIEAVKEHMRDEGIETR
jgi:imidazole glycerol phosphate synthase subunit HisF